jgi:precorrin-3B synthase
MTSPHRRGVCPALSAPMPTGDGLLVRLMPTEPVPLNAFIGFCEAARQHGNGTIEITARGSLQVRGLTSRSAPLFAAAVAELEMAVHEGIPVLTGPLVDDAEASIDTAVVVAELRIAIANARFALSPKVSVIVDGNARLHLDAISADIRLRVAGTAFQPRFCVGLAGDGGSATWLGSIAPRDAVDVVLGLLKIIAAHGLTARAADVLRVIGVEAFGDRPGFSIAPSSAPPQRSPAEMVGLHSARDGTIAIGVGLAFGYAKSDALAELFLGAASLGARAARPAPDRVLQLTGVPSAKADGLTASAERLGFVVRADDARRRFAACPGAPACTSGLLPARALASELTKIFEPILDRGRGGVSVHISGCLKGCAHPMPAALTLVGTPDGCGIIHDGPARAAPERYIDPANLGVEISRIVASAKEAAHG